MPNPLDWTARPGAGLLMERTLLGLVGGADLSVLPDGTPDLAALGITAQQRRGVGIPVLAAPSIAAGVLSLPTDTDAFTDLRFDGALGAGYTLQIRQLMPNVSPNRDAKLDLLFANSAYGWPNAANWNSLNQVAVWFGVYYFTNPAPTHHRILLETISDPQSLYASGTTVIDAAGQIAANAPFTQKLIYTSALMKAYANSILRQSTSVNLIDADKKPPDRSMAYMDSISTSGTAAARLTNFALMRKNTVQVSGLSAGQKARINGTSSPVAVAGVATWDAEGAIFPFATIEVLNADDSVAATLSPTNGVLGQAGVWGGDEYVLSSLWAARDAANPLVWS